MTEHVADLPRLGRFQTLAELGAGAMGIVYRAHDDVLGRAVAIKVVNGRSDAAVRERFVREAKAIATVLHPNILAIYDAATDEGTPYLVMELALGGSLRDRLQAGPLAVDTVRQVGIQIARALAAAHAVNIVHRDVKPGNILAASADVWKLGDFGIARLPDSTLTVGGQFLGSPSYAAPESLRAGEFSAASDVYGLAATLYEALTGSPPHGQEHASIMRKLDVDAPPLRARESQPETEPLHAAIMAGLARDPKQRPSAEVFALMLASVGAPRATTSAQVTTAHAANRTIAIVAFAAAAVAVIAIIAAINMRSQPTREVVAEPQSSLTPSLQAEPLPAPEPSPGPEPSLAPQPPAPPEPPTNPATISASDSGAPKLAGCTRFESTERSATWSGCADGVVRKIRCKPWVDEITCDCLEDGAERWFFAVEDYPNFATASSATRIASANCRMGFGR